MTMRLLFLVILILLHCIKLIAFVQHHGLSSFTRRRAKVIDNNFQIRVVHTRLHVLDNLLDCVANPVLGELYADSCLQTDGATVVVDSIAGLIRQAGTIGFLVMSYFFFKRSANGISDWDDDDEDDEDEFDVDDASSNNNFEGENNRADKLSRCPQCNGTGKFEWDGDNYVSVCDLCNGAGMSARSTRVKALGLPTSSRELWNPNGNGKNEKGNNGMGES